MSPRRTPAEIANTNGAPGPSSVGATGVELSGTPVRGPKYPANGPQTIATSTSPLATAYTSAAGGLGCAPDHLAALLFGPHGVRGLARLRPDVYFGADPEWYDALFPPLTSDLLTLYLPY